MYTRQSSLRQGGGLAAPQEAHDSQLIAVWRDPVSLRYGASEENNSMDAARSHDQMVYDRHRRFSSPAQLSHQQLSLEETILSTVPLHCNAATMEGVIMERVIIIIHSISTL